MATRLSSSLLKDAIVAFTVLFVSLLVAINFQAQQPSAVIKSVQESATAIEDMVDSGDTMSVLQGKVNVEPLGQQDLMEEKARGAEKATNELKGLHEAEAISQAPLSLAENVRQHLSSLRSRTSGPITFVLILLAVLLLLCVGVVAFGMAYPRKRPMQAGSPGDIANEINQWAKADGRNQDATAQNASQQQLLLDRNLSPSEPTPLGTGNVLPQGTTPLGVSPAFTPQRSHPGSHPVLSQTSLAHTFEAQVSSQPPGSQQFLMAPPLCSTLVMPVSEARFGVPMFELAEVQGEGEVTIVGLSGNPLLRGVVRRIGKARTLEISMPEQQSAPRATITPSMNELAGGPSAGCRVLEIRGKRGSFYGKLEMRSSGACYVIRDGQTVLAIDGEAESLQLSIKSPVGLQLASVRCSAEPFGGVDHVEIRVEPGVDSVLVVAVVLAVLLLSDPNDD